MPFGDILTPRIKVGAMTPSLKEYYYKALSGSQLVCSLYEGAGGDANLIARGSGLSWNETIQQQDVPEWGQRNSIEIVTGRQPIGQLTIQTFFFMNLNDSLPTTQGLKGWAQSELQAIVQIADHEDPNLAGFVLDVFEGVKIAAQSGNWNAQSQYMKNISLVYRVRMSGLEWKQKNPSESLQNGNAVQPYPAVAVVQPV